MRLALGIAYQQPTMDSLAYRQYQNPWISGSSTTLAGVCACVSFVCIQLFCQLLVGIIRCSANDT